MEIKVNFLVSQCGHTEMGTCRIPGFGKKTIVNQGHVTTGYCNAHKCGAAAERPKCSHDPGAWGSHRNLEPGCNYLRGEGGCICGRPPLWMP